MSFPENMEFIGGEVARFQYLNYEFNLGNLDSQKSVHVDFSLRIDIETTWDFDPQTFNRVDTKVRLVPYTYFNEYVFFKPGHYGDQEYCDVFPSHCIVNSVRMGSDSSYDGSPSWSLTGWPELYDTSWETGAGSKTFFAQYEYSLLMAPGENFTFLLFGMESETFWKLDIRERRACVMTNTCDLTPPDFGGTGPGDIAPVPLPGALGFGLVSGLMLAMLRACAGWRRRAQPSVA